MRFIVALQTVVYVHVDQTTREEAITAAIAVLDDGHDMGKSAEVTNRRDEMFYVEGEQPELLDCYPDPTKNWDAYLEYREGENK